MKNPGATPGTPDDSNGPRPTPDSARAPEWRPAPLPEVDGYRVVGLLGRGASGVVYSAVQVAVDRPVALKILHADLASGKQAIRRLQREARTTARLAHPCIVTAIDMGEQDGRWWYAMELVEGISLAERVAERGPLTERETLRLFIPVCEALQHAAEEGVVHRDLKPANILIDAHDRARIIDLGLAVAEDDPSLTRAGGTLGTPHYISPEQAQDARSADGRSDIWSLGATMFHAVCGRPPFGGDNVTAILSKVLTAPIPDPRSLAPGISRGFSLVLRKCLSRDPSRRYQHAAELMGDLEAIVERRAPRVRARQLEPVAGQEARARVQRLALGGVVAALLIVLGALANRDDDPAGSPESWPRVESWPAFEAIEESHRAGDLGAYAALEELKALAPGPESWEVRRRVFTTSMERELDQGAASVRVDLTRAVEADLALRRYDSARQRIVEGLDRSLEGQLGSDLLGLPRRTRSGMETWSRDLLQRIEFAADEAKQRAEGALLTYLEDQRPQFEELLVTHRFVDALALLDPDEGFWIAAGIDEPGLDDVRRRDARGILEWPLGRMRAQAREAYFAVDKELARFVEERRDSIETALRSGSVEDAAGLLLAQFQNHCTELLVDLSQIPGEWLIDSGRRIGAEARMEAACGELRLEEKRLLSERAQRLLRLDDARAASMCSARLYGPAAKLWERALAEPWREAVHGTVEARLVEVRLAQQGLERVASELRRRRDSGETVRLTLDRLTFRDAAVRIDGDVLEQGFLIQPRDSRARSRRVWVVPPPDLGPGEGVMGTEDLLELAGLSRIDLDAGDRFLRALLLFYEGDAAAARDALPLVDEVFEHRALIGDLQERLSQIINRDETTLKSRRRALEDELFALRAGPRFSSSEGGRLADLNRILVEYDDLLDAAQRRELAELKTGLERPDEVATFEDAYRSDRIELDGSEVTMTWEFPVGGRGAWQLGSLWHNQGPGLVLLTRAVHDEAFWANGRSVSLDLSPPLDLGERLELILECEFVDNCTEAELSLEVAGTVLVLVDRPGASLAGLDASGEGGGAQLLGEVRASVLRRATSVPRLPRGRAFELSLELNPRAGGSVEVVLDGLLLEELGGVPRVREFPSSPRVELRSSEPIRLRAARLRGRRLPP